MSPTTDNDLPAARDADLLRQLRSDPDAFAEFYRRHVDRVIGFCAKRIREPADVADLVSNTFLTVLTSADSYDPRRGEPTAWLLGISSRLIANTYRKRDREAALIGRVVGHRLLDSDDIHRLEERIDAARLSEPVIAAMARLSPRAQEALLLVADAHMSPAEAARFLGISGPAFRMRLAAARKAMRRALQTPPPQAPAPPHSSALRPQQLPS